MGFFFLFFFLFFFPSFFFFFLHFKLFVFCLFVSLSEMAVTGLLQQILS